MARRRASSPPRLRSPLLQMLGILLMVNVIPLCIFAYVAYLAFNGKIETGSVSKGMIISGATLLAACVTLAGAWWLGLPLAAWCRDYPSWHLKQEPSPKWLIATIFGYLAYIGLLLSCLMVIIVSFAVLYYGIAGMAQEAAQSM